MPHFELDSRVLVQNIVQRTAFGVLHHQEDMRSFGAGAEQLHDIRMGDAGQLANLKMKLIVFVFVWSLDGFTSILKAARSVSTSKYLMATTWSRQTAL